MLTILICATALTHFDRWISSICLLLQWYIISVSLSSKADLELPMLYYFC